MDRDCSVWDRIITLTATCATLDGGEELPLTYSAPFELGRWINAFQRKAGRWLTPAPLLPLLFPGGNSSLADERAAYSVDSSSYSDGGETAKRSVCNFSTSSGTGDHWLASLTLRFTPRTTPPHSTRATSMSLDSPVALEAEWGQPISVVPLKYPDCAAGGSFKGPSYNANRTLSFEVPPGVTRVAVGAVVTGHGGCEFQPTSHHWVINGQINGQTPDFNTSDPRYEDRYMQAGSAFGCADKTARGAVPNEHGTWYYGRNGWCDGLDVRPMVWDITSSVHTQGANALRYYALSYPVGQPGQPSEKGCGGIIDMSSFLLFYAN
jgi:hypothetical protein